MTQQVYWIDSVADFEATLGADCGSGPHILGTFKPEIEHEVREILHNMFADLQNLDASDYSERHLYLRDIEEPLHRLTALGLALLSAKTKDMKVVNGKQFQFVTAHYYVTLNLCLFGIDKGHVHWVCSDLCSVFQEEFHRALASGGDEVRTWFNPDALRDFYQNKIPWCATCCAQEVKRCAGDTKMFDFQQPDLEGLSNTLAHLFAQQGNTSAVAVLALAQPTLEFVSHDNWDGGTDYHRLVLAVPKTLYAQLGEERIQLEQTILKQVEEIFGTQQYQILNTVKITVQLTSTDKWREKAAEWIAGKGVTNQGRAHSNNIASRECDGLLFRSVPEINLYKGLKSLGVPFAPLPVFLKGGNNYTRIEPDFIVIHNGVVLHVEVDGDTFHHENPAAAHARTSLLSHEGVFVERVPATECDTEEKAALCAKKLVEILNKHKSAH